MRIKTTNNTQNKIKAYGYIRVSTMMQVDNGVSLDAQQDKIKKYCELNNFELVEIIADKGISGKDLTKRVGLKKLLANLKRGSVMIVYSLSRLARSIKDTLAISEVLQKNGVDLISITEKIDTTSAAGKMIFNMLAAMAQFESDTISERVKMCMSYKKTQGKRIGNIPYGFKLDVDGETLIKNNDEQAIIAFILKLRNELNMSFRKVLVAVNSQFKTRVNTLFQLTQIVRICNSI